MKKLLLTASRYRLPSEGVAPGRLVFAGEEFETDDANAARLITAGAAEEVKAGPRKPAAKAQAEPGDAQGSDPK